MDKLEFLRKQINARKDVVEHYEEKISKIAELEKQLDELKNELKDCDCESLKQEIDVLHEIAIQLDPNFILI